LVAAGQPLFTDDAWWHLALGREYAREGPWLPRDPLLFAAPGPPAPTAWAADLALHGVLDATGFGGLRVLHALGIAAILALCWSLLRRASGSAVAASLGTAAVAAVGAYRLIQLRPDLATMLATLLLYRLLLEPTAPPSWRRIALATGLMLVWVNLHGGFLIGPVLMATAAAGLLLAAPLRTAEHRRLDRARALRLGIALVPVTAATLVNPGGLAPHRAWFVSGSETPSVLRVADEWLPVSPFQLPVSDLPPSLLAWGLLWTLWLAFLVAAGFAARSWRREASTATGADPAQLATAAVGLVAPLVAVRFLWLCILPLLALASWVRPRLSPPRPAARWGLAAATLALVPGFLRAGDWPMISQAISAQSYGQPYPAAKWYAHAVWFLDDAGLEGNAFVDYFMGGFLGYWLAPELRVLMNGTLNVSSETLDAGRAIRQQRGATPEESFLELLDRLGIDVFVGIRLPEIGTPNRPWDYTTAHLEGAEGWMLVFRNLRSAVYLRTNERNAANLERVAAYYEKAGVSFEQGFDTWRVVREDRDWAQRNGLVPFDIDWVWEMARSAQLETREHGRNRLASLFAALGVYREAVRIDRLILAANPDARMARRRLVWSLLRMGRIEEAAAEAAVLEETDDDGWLAREIAAAARAAAAGEVDASRRVALLPLFTREEASRVLAGFVAPAPRPPRVERR
jgi:hypothetical protein